MCQKHKLQFNWRLQPASPRRDAPAAGYWLRPEDAKTGRIHCTKGVGYIPQCARCARLIRGFLSQRDSSLPKRHLDRLSVFAWLTGVPNTQARRPRYAAQTSVAIGRICAEYDMKSWRNKFICNSKKSVDNEARTRLRRPRVGHGSGRVGSGPVTNCGCGRVVQTWKRSSAMAVMLIVDTKTLAPAHIGTNLHMNRPRRQSGISTCSSHE